MTTKELLKEAKKKLKLCQDVLHCSKDNEFWKTKRHYYITICECLLEIDKIEKENAEKESAEI